VARPGYNDDNSLNTSVYSPPSRNTGNNSGGGNQGNQQSRDQTANELDQMINRSNPDKVYDDSWESQPNNYVEPYIPPSQIYNNAPPEQRRQWTHEKFGHSPMITDLLENMSPEVLDFWGVKNNSQSIPIELFKMISDGSMVGSNEQMYGDLNPNKSGFQYGNESNTGTWSDLETGNHELFPGGVQQYYNEMNFDNYIDEGKTTTTNNGGGPGGGYNYGPGSGYSNGSGYIAKPEINTYNPDFAQWGRSSVQGDFIRNQKANRGGIISLMR